MFGHTPFQFTGNARAVRIAAEKDDRRIRNESLVAESATQTPAAEESPVPGTASGQSLVDWARGLKR